MKKILIIPDKNNIKESLELADKYGVGFEYNDFKIPDVLDDTMALKETIDLYKSNRLPEYCTVHGAFMDVIPFSADSKIREISNMRIEQSIKAAKEMGAKAVVFHTNYNPFLNTKSYIGLWIDENIKYWSMILEKHSDINIYLENMFDDSYQIIEKISEELIKYDNYGVCLDYAHASITKVKPSDWASKIGRYVKHIHINDNDGISDLHLAWGEGIIDRFDFYDCYKKYMSNATILLETDGNENAKRSLEQLIADGFVKGLI